MQLDKLRFWLPVLCLCGLAAFSGRKLVKSHLELSANVKEPRYDFTEYVPAKRGAIYDTKCDGDGKPVALVRSVQGWEYRLDPVAMTTGVVRVDKKAKPRTRENQSRLIAGLLGLDYADVFAKATNSTDRYQYLGYSDSRAVHEHLTDPHLVAGVIARKRYKRQYNEGRSFSHIIGCVNSESDGYYGIELRFNKYLKGTPGQERGKLDARRRKLYDKPIEQIPAIPGADVYLTVNRDLQRYMETALKNGVAEYGAAAGWSVMLDAKTGEVISLASYPDFSPTDYDKATPDQAVNRVTAFTYEPGSVMKVITAASAIDAGFVRPDSLYSTDRREEGYYKLPGDGSHVWEPTMTVSNAIVHSSNIVIGKLGYQFGPKRLYDGMRRFGFGRHTGIELMDEQVGILRDPSVKMWDKATWSRAAIGQGVSVTAIQLASAYQAIANDGVRIPPRLVSKIVDANGEDVLDDADRPIAERVISAETARTMRRVMLAVASSAGTARRAAVPGYSVAGKTGTAQKVKDGKYAPGLYRATFCGIVPSGVVKRNPEDDAPVPPRVVILVSLDFEEKTRYHQGGNSAGPIFRRIASCAMRTFGVAPDCPDTAEEDDDDEYDHIAQDRTKELVEDDPEWDCEPISL
ncbi:MAG: penicillin-binding protein 2 [Kiritimatiellae bacterium]|nr:penicillin-binding protein 2 [Kiritimatiellia bacterium]